MKFNHSRFKFACAAMVMGVSAASLAAPQAAMPQAPTLQTPVESSAPAQSPIYSGVDLGTNDPTLTVRNEKALENFEPGVNEEYTLGAGDEITLTFPGRAELGGKKTIGPDGRITLDLVGPIRLAELTREQAQKAIGDALTPFYNNLSVTVSVDKYSSNSVRVLGYVLHPGAVQFEETPTLLNAISKAGLIQASTVGKDGSASSTGNSIPELCTIYRTTKDRKEVVTVQLRTMLTTGNALADMRLRRNDLIYVPQPKDLFVSVLGQVAKPGTIPLAPESTLTSVLALAGCCAIEGGFNPKIHIIQPATQREIIVQYKQLLTLSGQQEYVLHPGDVIYVNMSGFNKVATVIQKISPVATMVSLAAIVGAG